MAGVQEVASAAARTTLRWILVAAAVALELRLILACPSSLSAQKYALSFPYEIHCADNPQTSGSIIYPANNSNIVGIKPTVGLVSRNAVIPISTLQDTIGPMARTVHDAAAMLTYMAGPDIDDEQTNGFPFETVPDYASYVESATLSGIRLGVPRNALDDASEYVMTTFNIFLGELKEAGADILDIEFHGVPKYNDMMKASAGYTNLAAEFRVAVDSYLSKLVTNPNNIVNLESLIEYTKNTLEEEYPKRDIYWLEQSMLLNHDSPEYAQGLKDSDYFTNEGGVLGALETNKLDAIIAPSCTDIPNYFAARGGLPVITVPFGYSPEDTLVERNDSGNLVRKGPHIP
jgi:amidase